MVEPPSRSPDAFRSALGKAQPAWLARHRWLGPALPLAVFLLAGSLEPTPEKLGGAALGLAIPYAWYPLVYTLKIALTVAAIVVVRAFYREFPLRLSLWAIAVGITGIFVWVGLCSLGVERRLAAWLPLEWLIASGSRSAFNPFVVWPSHPAWAAAFLAVRGLGLVLVVPLAEEAFLRAWLMRVVIDPDWWKVPFGKLTPMAVMAGVVLPVLSHPAEMLAAAAWFSMVTWLMSRTRNFWDCVAAHAVTNLLLGAYVLWSGHWELL